MYSGSLCNSLRYVRKLYLGGARSAAVVAEGVPGGAAGARAPGGARAAGPVAATSGADAHRLLAAAAGGLRHGAGRAVVRAPGGAQAAGPRLRPRLSPAAIAGEHGAAE